MNTICKPMLMTGVNVCSILEGRKTQTRRIIKPQPIPVPESNIGGIKVEQSLVWAKGDQTQKAGDRPPPYGWNIYGRMAQLHAPHPIGSRIWVKETFLLKNAGRCVVYRADMDPIEASGFGAMYGGWKPSIFMRRAFCRIELEITRVRVEKLQDISERDAEEEGCKKGLEITPGRIPKGQVGHRTGYGISFRSGYKDLWQSINGKGSWAVNPFVWCYTFRRVKP